MVQRFPCKIDEYLKIIFHKNKINLKNKIFISILIQMLEIYICYLFTKFFNY